MPPKPPTPTPEFAKKHAEWLACLVGDDPNSILKQVYQMIWNAASFRVINRARRSAAKDAHGKPQVNPLVHVLLDRCFFESQMFAVRRQADDYGLTGKRGVYSLRSLIDDLEKNRHLLTRENRFAAAGRHMDLDAALAKEKDELRRAAAGESVEWTAESRLIAELHESFDSLSGTSAKNRSPNDVVSEDVFKGLKQQLTKVDKFIEPVNKLLAHAATPQSRALVPPDELSVTLGELWLAHEIICRCCQFLDGYVLRQTSHGFLPTPSHDVLQHMEKPLASDGEKHLLREEWKDYEKETASWSHTPIDWFTGAVAAPAATAAKPSTEPETKAAPAGPSDATPT